MLAELQRDFARAVRGDALAVPRSRHRCRRTQCRAPDRGLSQPPPHQPGRRRLAANFATVVKVVGEGAFQAHWLCPVCAIDPPRDACVVGLWRRLSGFSGTRSAVAESGLSRRCRAAGLGEERRRAARMIFATFTAEHLAAFDGDRARNASPAGPHPSLTLSLLAYPLLRIRDVAAGPGGGRVARCGRRRSR